MKWRCKEIADSPSLVVDVKPPVDETGVKGIVTVLGVGYDDGFVGQDLVKYPGNGYVLEVLIPLANIVVFTNFLNKSCGSTIFKKLARYNARQYL